MSRFLGLIYLPLLFALNAGAASDAELAIPRASIAQLWVVDGRKGNVWTGAKLGLLAGAVIGGVIGSTRIGTSVGMRLDAGGLGVSVAF